LWKSFLHFLPLTFTCLVSPLKTQGKSNIVSNLPCCQITMLHCNLTICQHFLTKTFLCFRTKSSTVFLWCSVAYANPFIPFRKLCILHNSSALIIESSALLCQARNTFLNNVTLLNSWALPRKK
jgi:hypothetical protein